MKKSLTIVAIVLSLVAGSCKTKKSSNAEIHIEDRIELFDGVAIKFNGKWGLQGGITKYDTICDVYGGGSGYFFVRLNGKWGLIDNVYGTTFVDPKFESIVDLYEYLEKPGLGKLADALIEEFKYNDSLQTVDEENSWNDIRFGKWTEKDWADNKYFRALRKFFNECYDGTIDPYTDWGAFSSLWEEYKPILNSKFVIVDAYPSVRSMDIHLIFEDAPSIVFRTAVFSYVNYEAKEVTGYCVYPPLETYPIKDRYPIEEDEEVVFFVEKNKKNNLKLW